MIRFTSVFVSMLAAGAFLQVHLVKHRNIMTIRTLDCFMMNIINNHQQELSVQLDDLPSRFDDVLAQQVVVARFYQF